MSITLDITGVLQAAAFWVSNKGSSHGYKLFFYFYLLLTALSVCLGNDPVILSGTTFLVYFTKVTEVRFLTVSRTPIYAVYDSSIPYHGSYRNLRLQTLQAWSSSLEIPQTSSSARDFRSITRRSLRTLSSLSWDAALFALWHLEYNSTSPAIYHVASLWPKISTLCPFLLIRLVHVLVVHSLGRVLSSSSSPASSILTHGRSASRSLPPSLYTTLCGIITDG